MLALSLATSLQADFAVRSLRHDGTVEWTPPEDVVHEYRIEGTDDLEKWQHLGLSIAADKVAVEGETVIFTVDPNGDPPPSIRWRHNGVNLGTSSAILEVNALEASAGGFQGIEHPPYFSIKGVRHLRR